VTVVLEGVVVVVVVVVVEAVVVVLSAQLQTTHTTQNLSISYQLILVSILTKAKSHDIYIPPLTGKPEQQRFSNSSRQRNAIRTLIVICSKQIDLHRTIVH